MRSEAAIREKIDIDMAELQGRKRPTNARMAALVARIDALKWVLEERATFEGFES